MAVAGRVAIVPKEDYVPGMPFKRLDLVRYQNKIYLAKKDGSGIYPPNETYWMLMITNADVSAEVEEIQKNIGILSDVAFGKSAKVPMVTKDGKRFVTNTGAKFVALWNAGIEDIRYDTYYNQKLIAELQKEIDLRGEIMGKMQQYIEELQQQILTSNFMIRDLQDEVVKQKAEIEKQQTAIVNQGTNIQTLLNRKYFAPVISS